ncbi:MAG: family intrarane metalloprotease [Clostridiales bacterium]|jgi:membrane protease YdiL (CAAX protease family)|nr:family intrarane metalloprotease [Clostridiales bacterium]
MGKNITYMDILKSLSVLALLALPPWFVFRKYVKDRINRYLLILMFIIYIGITLFTEQLMPFILVIFIFIFMGRFREDNELTYYFRPLKKKKLEILLYSIVFMFLSKLVSAVFVLIINQVFHIELESQEIMDMFLKGSWLAIIALTVLTVVIAPVLEEFIFRHILYGGISKKIGKIAAAIISSLLFTLLHYNLAGVVAFFAVGIYNCYLYEKYGYRAAVINHSIFNLSSTAIIILIKALNMSIA